VSSVTISSGVHVGERDDTLPRMEWFDPYPVEQFTAFTLALADVQVLTSVEGRPGDREPLLMRFQGRGMSTSYDLLKAVDVRELLNGEPRTAMSGFKDAMARSGRLVKISMRIWRDAYERSEWGVLTQVRNQIGGGEGSWGVSAIFMPCDALGLINTTTWYMSPAAYVAPSAPAEGDG
jgi:hypothetical protein